MRHDPLKTIHHEAGVTGQQCIDDAMIVPQLVAVWGIIVSLIQTFKLCHGRSGPNKYIMTTQVPSGMSSLLAQAAEMRAAMDAGKRTRFDAYAEYLRATLFLRSAEPVVSACDAPLHEQLRFASEWRAQGNELFAERDFDAAARLYTQGVSLFRYVHSKDAQWRRSGIVDANLSLVDPTDAAAVAECVRLLTNLSLTATRVNKHDEAVAAAKDAVRLDGDDAKAQVRLAAALMDNPGLGSEALESASDAIARARRIVDDRVMGMHAAGDAEGANAVDVTSLKRQILALETRIEAQTRAYRDRMQRALQQQMKEQAAAAAAATAQQAAATPAPAVKVSTLPPLPPALMAHAAARGLDLNDPRVRRELLRLDAEEVAKKTGKAAAAADDPAAAPTAARVRDPALRQLLREMKDMTAPELRHVLALLRGDSTDTTSAHAMMDGELNTPEAVALRREIVAEAVKLSDGAHAAEAAQSWRATAVRAIRWGATALIVAFVLYRIMLLVFVSPVSSVGQPRGGGSFASSLASHEDEFAPPADMDEL